MTTLFVQFDDSNITADNLNDVFDKIAAALNSLLGEQVYAVGALPPSQSNAYIPITGGASLGAITAPSVLVGPNPNGPFKQVITVGDEPQAGKRAGVLQAAAITALGQTISGSYTQAEVQAISDKVDELRAALETAGVISAS